MMETFQLIGFSHTHFIFDFFAKLISFSNCFDQIKTYFSNAEMCHLPLLVLGSNDQKVIFSHCYSTVAPFTTVIQLFLCPINFSEVKNYITAKSHLCWWMWGNDRQHCVAPEMDLGECTLHLPVQKANKAEPTLALKPRGNVTRNPKQGYQWPQKGHVSAKNFKEIKTTPQ